MCASRPRDKLMRARARELQNNTHKDMKMIIDSYRETHVFSSGEDQRSSRKNDINSKI